MPHPNSAEAAALRLGQPGGVVQQGAVDQLYDWAITLAAGATNTIVATFQAKDAGGNNLSGVRAIEAWISESATGSGLTGDAASGALTATAGAILTALTAKKHVLGVTDSTGKLVLSLVDTAEPTDQLFCARRPDGSVKVSAASGTSWG